MREDTAGTPLLDRLYGFDEDIARQLKDGLMAGVDEAGRGPLAGPVVAAAVVLFRGGRFPFLNDSKKVLPNRRQKLFGEISQHGLVGIGVVDEKQIDRLNIYQATRLAMKRAVLALPRTPDFILIDGKICLDLPLPQRSIVRGDQKSACIAAASIVAKVHRDALMVALDRIYPDYGFKHHKGYGTPGHLKRIQENGPSPIHRRSFAPVRAWDKGLFPR